MPCCSSRRSGMTLAPPLRAAPVTTTAPALSGPSPQYTGAASLALRGPASGRIYRVGPGRRQIMADSRDIAALLNTGQFRQWGKSDQGAAPDPMI